MPNLGKSKIGRKKAARKAVIIQGANALILHKRITTLKVRAKMIARYIAPIITKARRDQEANPLHAKREAFRRLRDKKSTQTLLKEIVPQVGDRPGGYTRIITLGKRPGDAATQAMIELVDYNLIYSKQKTKTKTTRRSRKKSKPTAAQTSPEKVADNMTTQPANAKS